MEQIYKINNNLVFEDVYLANIDNNTYYKGIEWLEIDFIYVEVKPPNAKVVKWENEKWVVLEEYPIEPIRPQEPTEIETQRQIINTLGQELAQLKLQFMMGGI